MRDAYGGKAASYTPKLLTTSSKLRELMLPRERNNSLNESVELLTRRTRELNLDYLIMDVDAGNFYSATKSSNVVGTSFNFEALVDMFSKCPEMSFLQQLVLKLSMQNVRVLVKLYTDPTVEDYWKLKQDAYMAKCRSSLPDTITSAVFNTYTTEDHHQVGFSLRTHLWIDALLHAMYNSLGGGAVALTVNWISAESITIPEDETPLFEPQNSILMDADLTLAKYVNSGSRARDNNLHVVLVKDYDLTYLVQASEKVVLLSHNSFNCCFIHEQRHLLDPDDSSNEEFCEVLTELALGMLVY